MRRRVLLILAFLGSLGVGTLRAKEVLWRIGPATRIRSVFQEGTRLYDSSSARNDPGTISSFSQEEKRWLAGVFPEGQFRLLKQGPEGYPDEYLVLPDSRVLSQDDLFSVPARDPQSLALLLILRPSLGLLAADGQAPLSRGATAPLLPPSPSPTPEEDLDRLLYSDDPPPPPPSQVAPTPPPELAPPPAPPVDRSQLPGELRFLILEPAPGGSLQISFQAPASGGLGALDLIQIRSLQWHGTQAWGWLSQWRDEAGLHRQYQLYIQGAGGISEAWAARILDFSPDLLQRKGCRFSLSSVEGPDGVEPELLVRAVSLEELQTLPSPEAFLPEVGGAGTPIQGVVDILRLRGGRFKRIGRADRTKGGDLVDLRRNWPDYLAFSSRGPSQLLAFGSPNSPFTYRCPWPGHPSEEIPWVKAESLFKGREFLAGERDLRLSVWFLHDPQALYLMALVEDDHLVLPGLEQDPDQGDHLQLWLDPQYQDRSLMLELFPGSPPGAGALARVRSPSALAGPALRVRLAARQVEGGYWLEAAIPFRYLEDAGLRPTGSLWGMAVNAVDVDDPAKPEDKTVLSTSKEFRWAETSTFNNLILE